MDSTYDPSKPWHILTQRGDEWQVVQTFDRAVEVILFVGNAPAPERFIVRHMPSDNDGTGSAFLREVNRRMRQHG